MQIQMPQEHLTMQIARQVLVWKAEICGIFSQMVDPPFMNQRC